jgi:hypothetical protein
VVRFCFWLFMKWVASLLVMPFVIVVAIPVLLLNVLIEAVILDWEIFNRDAKK